MNTKALIEAQRAHVAAHGRDCGRGNGRSKDPCAALYRAWYHMSTGEWKPEHPVLQRLRSQAYDATHREERRAAHRATRERDPESARASCRRWARANPQAVKALDRRRNDLRRADPGYNAKRRAHYAANRDKMRGAARQYRSEHAEELSAKRRRDRVNGRGIATERAYRDANRDKIREQTRLRQSTPAWRAKHAEAERARRRAKRMLATGPMNA